MRTLRDECEEWKQAASVEAGLRREFLARSERLETALSESLKLQSHYAALLNNYDGGTRMQFPTVEAWLARLDATSK